MIRRLAAVVLAWVASRIIFALLGFRYSPFRDGFDLTKLAIDLGVWACCYVAATWALQPREGTAAGV